jgi:mono/diheme cytochrome c family protein
MPDRPKATARIRRGRAVGAALGTVALAVLGCALRNPFRADGELREEGRASYQRACASCHGDDARGWGPVAPALVSAPPDLTTLAVRFGGTFPRGHVIDVIVGRRNVAAHGTGEMPVWGERFGATGPGGVAAAHARRRLETLADYLESLQGGPR